MIDEERTLELFGYTSDELSRGSDKTAIVVCEECGEYRTTAKKQYRDLCKWCSQHTDEFKHSQQAWWTDDRRRMMGRARTGENNFMFGVCGDNAPAWKGGITPWRYSIYKSPAYRNWRTSVFIRDNRTCQKCGAHTKDIQAHHIIPVRDNKNTLLTFDINNGITLCKGCHEEVNGHESDYIDIFMKIIEVGDKQ